MDRRRNALLMAPPVSAHRPLGGLPSEILAHGLLSGVGHPVLGYVAIMPGVLIVSFGRALPVTETMIALSPLNLCGIVLSGRALSLPASRAQWWQRWAFPSRSRR